MLISERSKFTFLWYKLWNCVFNVGKGIELDNKTGNYANGWY